MSSQPFTTNSAAVVTTTAHVRPMSGEQAALVARFASPTIARVRRNSVRLISLTALAMSMAACNTIPKADSRPVLTSLSNKATVPLIRKRPVTQPSLVLRDNAGRTSIAMSA